MDGFEGNSGVVILAATNRPESLAPALTRPGWLDRRAPVELHDRQVVALVKKQHEKEAGILMENLGKLEEHSRYLYEKETITGDKFMAILNA